MKRRQKRGIAFLMLMLLSACSAATPVAAQPSAVPTEAPTRAPIETPACTANPTEAPTENPVFAPESTAAPQGLLGERFAERFSETPVKTERSYQSSTVSISVETYDTQGVYSAGRVIYHVADIYVQDVTAIRTEAAEQDFNRIDRSPVRDIAERAGALVAIVGDTYSREHGGLVVRNGEWYRRRPFENTDICILYRYGVMETKKWGTFTVQQIVNANPWQVWDFGPALLDENGKAMEITHRLMGPNPRTAIGYYEPGHYCFVVVDGRGESDGVSLSMLSKLMEDLGCVVAYNLDGGGSAQLYWDGEIVSTPSSGTRTVSDIIYLLPEADGD